MSTYSVTLNPGTMGYDVTVEFENGGLYVVQGFKTEAEAKVWVVEDKRVMGLRRRREANNLMRTPGR